MAVSGCWRGQAAGGCVTLPLPVPPAVGHDSFAESSFCSKEVAKGLNDIITYGGADHLPGACCLLGSSRAC